MAGITLNAYNPDSQVDGFDTSLEREEAAKIALKGYDAELACRFADGGNYDTYKIATGETFVEIVCGGYFNGYIPVHCFDPLTAVQLFIDAMERYFVSVPHGKTLHWHTHPDWAQRKREMYEKDGKRITGIYEQVYSIYARLVLV